MWTSVEDGLPPERRSVVVMTEGCWTPLVGYWKMFSIGPSWIVPGHGGMVLWWADVIPTPYPDERKEEFRRGYEHVPAIPATSHPDQSAGSASSSGAC